MAKRARRKAADESFEDQDKEVPIQGRDIETMGKLQRLASAVAEVAKKRRDPYLEVPSRSLSNSNYNRRKRLIEMGGKTNRRELFNLNQARAYMQTILVGSGCSRLIRQGKSTSIRGMYYMLKHNIEGTKENTFEDQSESDTIIEDLEVITGAMREELHLYAEPRGTNIVVGFRQIVCLRTWQCTCNNISIKLNGNNHTMHATSAQHEPNTMHTGMRMPTSNQPVLRSTAVGW